MLLQGLELRAAIVAEARSWVDTPFHHQGRLKGEKGGVDCAGVVIGTAQNLGLSEFDVTGYSHQPNEEEFRAAVKANLVTIQYDQLKPGDMVTMRFDKEQHIAIVTKVDPDSGDLIGVHAYARIRKCVESVLESARIVECYRFPELVGIQI